MPVRFATRPSQQSNEFELVIEAALPRKILYPRFEGTVRVRTIGGFGAELDLNGIIDMPLGGATDDCKRALEVMVAWIADEIKNRIAMTPERFAQRRRLERDLGITQS